MDGTPPLTRPPGPAPGARSAPPGRSSAATGAAAAAPARASRGAARQIRWFPGGFFGLESGPCKNPQGTYPPAGIEVLGSRQRQLEWEPKLINQSEPEKSNW